MSFLEFLSNNASTIAALVGVLFGAAGTYIIQSQMLKKQRIWQLMDLRRDLKVNRLREMEEAINKTAAYKIQMRLSNTKNSETLLTDSINLSNVLIKVDTTIDDKLKNLFLDWVKLMQEVNLNIGKSFDETGETIVTKSEGEFLISCHNVQNRINELILETLNEKS